MCVCLRFYSHLNACFRTNRGRNAVERGRNFERRNFERIDFIEINVADSRGPHTRLKGFRHNKAGSLNKVGGEHLEDASVFGRF